MSSSVFVLSMLFFLYFPCFFPLFLFSFSFTSFFYELFSEEFCGKMKLSSIIFFYNPSIKYFSILFQVMLENAVRRNRLAYVFTGNTSLNFVFFFLRMGRTKRERYSKSGFFFLFFFSLSPSLSVLKNMWPATFWDK